MIEMTQPRREYSLQLRRYGYTVGVRQDKPQEVIAFGWRLHSARKDTDRLKSIPYVGPQLSVSKCRALNLGCHCS